MSGNRGPEQSRSRWVVQRAQVLAKVENLLVTDAEIKSGTVHYEIGRMTPEWARDQATHWLAIAEYLDPEWPRSGVFDSYAVVELADGTVIGDGETLATLPVSGVAGEPTS